MTHTYLLTPYTLEDYYPSWDMDTDMEVSFTRAQDMLTRTIRQHDPDFSIYDEYQIIPHQMAAYQLLFHQYGLDPATATSRQIWEKMHARVISMNPPAYTPSHPLFAYLRTSFTGKALLLWGDNLALEIPYTDAPALEPLDTPDNKRFAVAEGVSAPPFTTHVQDYNQALITQYQNTRDILLNPVSYPFTDYSEHATITLHTIPDDWADYQANNTYLPLEEQPLPSFFQ